LFDLGEYEQAIEWQRKAWFISAPAIADVLHKTDNLKLGIRILLCVHIVVRIPVFWETWQAFGMLWLTLTYLALDKQNSIMFV
jgi:hypothetical protein